MLNWLLTFFSELWLQLQIVRGPFDSAVIIFFNGGWIPAVILLLWALKNEWFLWRWEVYHMKTREYVLLAIDVPRANDQSPKAVENVFAHIHGMLTGTGKVTIHERWWLGKTVDYISMELVSMEGYVQFLVYTQVEYRDLVESAFYAQYPDAEITEVEDYIYGENGEFKNMQFPNSEYNVVGSEFVFERPDAFPIRMYTEFEHALSQEFKDPMASLLEMLNKLGPGEQMWIQLVLTPWPNRLWQPQANAVAMKIAGKKVEAKENVVDKAVSALIKFLDAVGVAVFPFYGPGAEDQPKKEELPSLMLHLTPTERAQVEGIQKKADKVAYWTKFRFVYIGKKSAGVNPKSRIPSIIGSIKQFNSLNLNTFRTHKYTRCWDLHYLFVDQRHDRRRRNILKAYQGRSRARGSHGIMLNVEELATIYHFPTEVVKAPLIARTQATRGGAPMELPMKEGPIVRVKSPSSPPARPVPRSLLSPEALAKGDGEGGGGEGVVGAPRPAEPEPVRPTEPTLPTPVASSAPPHPAIEAPENLPFV